MKRIKLARRWRDRLSDTEVAEYPKGSTAIVSDKVALRAEKADVLDGPAVEAKVEIEGKPGSPEGEGAAD